MTEKEHVEMLNTQLEEAIAPHQYSHLTLGMVSNYADCDETRFFLTPEACGMLTASNLHIIMQQGAATDINFRDEDYANFGVEIVSRTEALKSDIVLSYAPLKSEDILMMRKGSVLLCMMTAQLFTPEAINALLNQEITLGCFDNMLSHNDEPVFADIIDEINGRAAIMYAQDYLSFTGGGKGVLLEGVAGLNPCEVLILGEGRDVCSAANAAARSGADVTLMNNDISALNVARDVCDSAVKTIAIHPRVLTNRIKTADVIILGNCTRPFEIPKSLMGVMKESVYLLNLEDSNPSVCVPRTVAMALSNILVNFFEEMIIKNGFLGMLETTPGVQQGIVTFRGKLVDKLIASFLALPCVDINVMLTHTN